MALTDYGYFACMGLQGYFRPVAPSVQATYSTVRNDSMVIEQAECELEGGESRLAKGASGRTLVKVADGRSDRKGVASEVVPIKGQSKQARNMRPSSDAHDSSDETALLAEQSTRPQLAKGSTSAKGATGKNRVGLSRAKACDGCS